VIDAQAEFADAQEAFDERDDVDEGGVDFEEGEDALDFHGINTALPAPGQIYRGADGKQFFFSAERFAEAGITKDDGSPAGGIEALIARLEQENPNELFELVRADEVARDQLVNKHGPRGPATEAAHARDELGIAAHQEKTRTSVGLPATFDEANPLSALEGQFAIRRSKVSAKLDAREELELTDADLRPGLSDFETKRKAIAKGKKGADKAAIDVQYDDIAMRRSILRELTVDGELRNTSEFFVKSPQGRDKAIFAPKLTRKMVNRLRFNSDLPVSGHVSPAEASLAFLLAMNSLKAAGFDVSSVPKNTVIFKGKRSGEADMTAAEAINFERRRTAKAVSASQRERGFEPEFEEEDFVGGDFQERGGSGSTKAGDDFDAIQTARVKFQVQKLSIPLRGVLDAHVRKFEDESLRVQQEATLESLQAVTEMQYDEASGRSGLSQEFTIEGTARRVLRDVKDAKNREAHVGLLKDWSKLLGIKARLLDVEEAVDILLAQNDYARLRGILRGSLHGFSLADGRLFVNPQLRSDMQVEVLAHETGHVVFKQTVPKNFDAVHEAWDTWRQDFDRPGARVKNIQASKQRLRAAIKDAYNHNGLTLASLSDADRTYLLDFEEWFADQTSLWLTQPNSKPKNEVEEWFAGFVSKLRKIFGSLTTGKVIPDEQADAFLSERIASFAAKTTKTQAHIEARAADSRVITDSRELTFDELQAKRSFVLAAAVEADPMSDVSHAGILGFIDEIMTAEEKSALGAAFTQGSVRQQMNKAFKDFPEVLQAMDGSISETIAYGYQLWTAGEVQLGPRTEGILGKIITYVRKLLGFVTQLEQADQILDQLTQQTFDLSRLTSQGSAFDVKVAVRETVLQNVAQYTNEMYDTWAKPWMDKLLVSGLSRMLDTGNAALIQIATRAHTPPNLQGVSEGWIATKESERVKFMRDMTAATKGTTDPVVLKAVWRSLMLNEPTGSAEQDHMVSEVRKRIADIYNYATRKGLKMGERKDYFPWVYDREYLQGHKDEFIDLLQRPSYRVFINQMAKAYSDSFKAHELKVELYRKALASGELEEIEHVEPPQFTKHERQAADIIERFGSIDSAGIAEIIYESITDADGYADAEINFSRVSHTPFVRGMNTRSLGFLMTEGNAKDRADFLKFFNGDFDYTIRTYIDQIVKRAEYTDAYNAVENKNGVVVSDVERLLGEAESLGATESQMTLARDFVNSMQGTHGARTSQRLGTIPLIGDKIGSGPDDTMRVINPRLQMLNSWLIIWQNFRVLGLATLTSLADPVGIAVRGGSGDTVMASLRALSKDSKAREIAEKLGIIHSSTINEMLGAMYSNNFMTAASQATNEKFFKYIGLSALTKATRVMGTGAGLEFIRSHAQSDTAQSREFLADLNLEAVDVVLDEQSNIVIRNRAEMDALWASFESGPSQGDPTILAEIEREERLRKAINRFVDEAVLRPNAANRPIWASDPHFAIFFHLKSFIYTFHNQILRRVYNEAVKGNYVPAAMLMVYVPFMLVADLLRDIARFGFEGNPRKARWSIMDYTGTAIQRAGLPGLSTFMLDAQQDRQFGGFGFESFLGPTFSFSGDIDDIMFDNDQGRYQALIDQLPFQNTFALEGFR
jgi:hypothetical protein